MEEQKVNGQKGSTPTYAVIRDILTILFRRRRLIRRAFLWSLLGALLAVLLFGLWYESDMMVIVKHIRTEMAVTPDQSARPQLPSDSDATTLEINNEVELMTSDDLLDHIVVTCGLQYGNPGWFQPYRVKLYRAIPGWEDTMIPKAAKKLNSDLEVTAVKDAGMISVSYTSNNPDVSACVIHALSVFYMQKRMQVMKPPAIYDFFAQQAENYRKRLYAAEGRLLDFARNQDAVEAQVQTGLDVQQQSQFLATLRQTQANIAQTMEKIRADGAEITKTPPRITHLYVNSDNAGLLASLKSTLVNLELQRTDLLRKYDPSYPLVQEVETQITQARAALAREEKTPLHSDTTDPNPTYQLLVEDLAKVNTTLPALQAEAATLERMVKAYHDEALGFNQKGMTTKDLARDASAEEQNYLLYVTKREQARIEDMLDARQVLNVIISEPPTVPEIPTFSPFLLIFLAFLLAIFLSVGMAFAVDYLDPSFRTPDEVKEFLNVPVFASIPDNGESVPVGSILKNSG